MQVLFKSSPNWKININVCIVCFRLLLYSKGYACRYFVVLVYGCAVSTDGEKIYVVNRNNGLLQSLSRNGDVLATLVILGTWFTNLHVHVAQTGQIIWCCTASQSIIQVDSECSKILGTTCMRQYSKQPPRSVYYSKIKSAIVVGMNFDKILVLQTKTCLC